MGTENKKKKKNKAGDQGGKRGGNYHPQNEGGKIITDARFSSVHFDPRFREAPKRNSKVVIDSRFDRMFTDKNFASSKAPIDKRGKLRKNSHSQNPLKHYYHLEEEENQVEKGHGLKKVATEEKEEEIESQKSESESERKGEGKGEGEDLKKRKSLLTRESESESESEGEKLKKRKSVLKSELEESSESEDDSHDSDESSSTSTTDSDEGDKAYLEEEEDDAFMHQEDNIPEIDNETRRLAVVNLDWNQVRAVDLYVLLSSFLPKDGQIMSVAVYPSEFGLKRMEEEAVHGPVGLFDDGEEDEQDDEFDDKKLRAYELSRLRYYYAVVECDSSATADYLYKTCDGVEFERSSNKLDLRFIPDTMEFKHRPRDVATEAPTDYEGLDFQTRALQHSNIQLTWDEDEPQRSKTLKRKLNAEQLDELELKEFLASDESEADDNDDDNDTEDRSVKRRRKQDMYRVLLQSGDVLFHVSNPCNQICQLWFSPKHPSSPPPYCPVLLSSAVYARQMAQKNKGVQENATGTLHTEISGQFLSNNKLEMLKDKDLQPDVSNPERGKDISSLVKSLKMKTKQANLSSQRDVKGKVAPSRVKVKRHLQINFDSINCRKHSTKINF
ncbi:Hypothetical predicted protein [Olea europaea subsp. europaea]|nr:Hypothetical predicted protein [Olea europaea subsp. europaea]